jgi:hypothetical protein
MLCLFTVARPGGASRGISGTLKREGGESVVVIPRFLCGSSRPCRLRTAPLWPPWQALSCVLTACQVLWAPISRVAFVTNMSYVRAFESQAYGVLVRFFPCRVYIDSSRRDTLGYEWQLIVAVIS